LKLEQSLYTILQILSLTLFEKIPISCAFSDDVYRNKIASGPMQLNLFESSPDTNGLNYLKKNTIYHLALYKAAMVSKGSEKMVNVNLIPSYQNCRKMSWSRAN